MRKLMIIPLLGMLCVPVSAREDGYHIFAESNMMVCGGDGFVYFHDKWIGHYPNAQVHFKKIEDSQELCKLMVKTSPSTPGVPELDE